MADLIRKKWAGKRWILLFLTVFFVTLLLGKLEQQKRYQRLQMDTVKSASFRRQSIPNEMLAYFQETKEKNIGTLAGIYLLESRFGEEQKQWDTKAIIQLERKIQDPAYMRNWRRQKSWESYQKWCEAIWNDLKYFPVAQEEQGKGRGKETVTYSDSWQHERTYGGKRGHEGTDLMAAENVPGKYPVVSMTDGIVTNKGWLEKGGWRIGITAPSGGYFYYAHLDSYAAIAVGDEVKAGEIIGFMGDSGYGPEGTVGKFPVHLHVGIYIYPDGEEISINPYAPLKYVEKCGRKYFRMS